MRFNPLFFFSEIIVFNHHFLSIEIQRNKINIAKVSSGGRGYKLLKKPVCREIFVLREHHEARQRTRPVYKQQDLLEKVVEMNISGLRFHRSVVRSSEASVNAWFVWVKFKVAASVWISSIWPSASTATTTRRQFAFQVFDV